jgi:hypothetical protein
MGRKVKQLKNYTTEQDENNIVGVKLYATIQLTGCYSTHKFYHVTHKQICNWTYRFDAEGTDGLRIKPGRGRQPFITDAQVEQLKTGLSKSPLLSEICNFAWYIRQLAITVCNKKYYIWILKSIIKHKVDYKSF